MTSVTERAEKMQKLFGRQWIDMVPLLERGGDAIRAASDSIGEGLVVTEDAIKANREYMKAVDDLSDSWTAFKFNMLEGVVPAITEVLDRANQMRELKDMGFSNFDAAKILEAARAAEEYGSAAREAGKAAQYSGQEISAAGAAAEEAADQADNANTKWSNLAPQFREIGSAAREAAGHASAMAAASSELAAAQTSLNEAQMAWKQDVGNDMGSMLESAGLSQETYMEALAATDEVTGTSLKPAQELKNAQKELIDELARTKDVDAYREGLENLQETFAPLNESIQTATGLVDILQGKLDMLVGHYVATVEVRETGSGVPSTTGGGGRGKYGGDQADFANGAENFVVPPGYPNDSFKVGLTSGEVANIAPAGQSPAPAAGVTINGNIILPGVTNPAQFMRELGRLTNNKATGGAGYSRA
jgi:hypothetical protein